MSLKYPTLVVAVHGLLGILFAQAPGLTFYWGTGVLLFGLTDIVLTGNRGNRAALYAGYFVGAEVCLRMTNGYIFWEAGKYGVVLLLITGLISERIQQNPRPASLVTYFLLLLPSLTVVDFPDFETAREEVSFNLSGPLVLMVSSVYFYRRPISRDGLVAVFRNVVFPLVVMLVYLILVTPSIDEIQYGGESNFKASGGFGPNQVSTMIGVAMFILATGRFYKFTISGLAWLDIVLFLLFSFRGLATFSRGGVIGSLIGIFIILAATAVISPKGRALYTTISFIVIFSIAGIYVWNYVNDQTGGKLESRYLGVNYATGEQRDISSGRSEIMNNELELFRENPFAGIGPGMGKILVKNKFGLAAHSHSEYTRLLAEHGAFGIISFLIMIIVPIREILARPRHMRPLQLALFAFVLFTLFHSAMRLALPGYLYGLVLLNFVIYKSKTATTGQYASKNTNGHHRMAYKGATL